MVNEPKARRNCQSVILEMINVIPEDNIKFIDALKWNYGDAAYKAPEETIQWERTMQTIIEHIPIPNCDWEYEVLSIFTTMPVEAIKGRMKDG